MITGLLSLVSDSMGSSSMRLLPQSMLFARVRVRAAMCARDAVAEVFGV